MAQQLVNLTDVLEEHIPAEQLAEVKRILFGNPTTFEPPLRRKRVSRDVVDSTIELAENAKTLASSKDFEIQSFGFPCPKEQVGSLKSLVGRLSCQ